MSTLNLQLLSLHRIKDQEIPILPGLLAQNAPKRPARGRENDRLLIYLNLAGNISYTPAEYAQITAKLAERFYQTSGSLTFALKSSIEALNAVLAERNMKTTGQGKYSIGVLVMAALRGELLYIVQAGPTRVHWLSQGATKIFQDASLAGKGLGLSQNTRMYFAQAQLRPGDLLVMSANQPKEWQAALESPGPVSLETLRRRLATVTSDSLNAVLISASEGLGETSILRSAKSESGSSPLAAPAPPPELVPAPELAEPAAPAALLSLQESESTPEAAPAPSILPVSRPPLAPIPIPAAPASRISKTENKRPKPAPVLTPERRTQMVHVGRRSARWMAQAIHAGRDISQRVTEFFKKFAPRLLPQEEGQPETQLSGAWMAFIAVAIPILIVTVATTIYTRIGNPALYAIHYTRASEAATQAQALNDPAELRQKWQATLDYLKLAESFRITQESESLRNSAQTALDTLDRVTRVPYRPAFNAPLSANLNIRRLAASDFDLYLLTGEGNVLRATLNNGMYNLQDFNCKPGKYEGITVGPLIDIIALPRTSPGGVTLMGMDVSGNLLYCSAGQQPTASFLIMPDGKREEINAFTYDAGVLYVLDAKANAVWTYTGQPGKAFSEPLFFFEQDIPRLTEAIDMAVSGDDLYILHADGHLTTCTYSRIFTSPTRCTDPATLIDTRPGYQSGPTLTDGIARQIFFTQAPNPAVNLLEPNRRTISRFSPRSLELQSQIQSLPADNDPLPQSLPITAMTFSPNKILFVLAGGQVYFVASAP
ncbi:MAG: hypothetical protein RBS68_13640 [Anaerolineales bacterium]|jgi:hypothetical protein|nr:hypothetical protein [Anaerolineales bacterium]